MKPVLIVDDSLTVRLYHRQIVEGLGLPVEEAKDGAEALEVALRGEFALLLVDINMPKVDGYRFVRTVRDTPHLRDVPVVMISTESETKDQTRAFEAGANLYLEKPIEADLLRLYVGLLTGTDVS